MKGITRKKFLKISLATASAAIVGKGIHSLLNQRSSDELYGTYPETIRYQFPKPDFSAPRPNIVLINCDDLGYGDTGPYGNSIIRTPNIDRLASEGARFTSFYSCNAVCAPSRAGLLTGRYPFRTGIIGNTYPKKEALGKRIARNMGVMLKGLGVLDIREKYVGRGIHDAEITLAEALRAAGYATAMTGKWHLGDYSTNPSFNPRRHGFDHYLGVPYSNDMIPLPLFRDEKMIRSDLGTGEEQATLTGMYTKEAVRFIHEQERRPFFLYMAHTFPHQPLHASEKFRNQSRAGRYGDAVEELDWSVGEILDTLEKKGLRQNTLVIFTSDNGPWYEGNTGGLRGRKGQSMEGGFRVPFIASWPKTIPRGITQEAAAMNIDLFPTLLKVAGLSLPKDRIIDGKDILPQLTGKSRSDSQEQYYFYHYDQLEGIRSGKWKYYRRIHRYTWPIPLDAAPVPNALGKKQLGNRWPLLYDVRRDPEESYNLYSTHPDTGKKLHEMLEQWERANAYHPRGFK